jgi:hypothetical protein
MWNIMLIHVLAEWKNSGVWCEDTATHTEVWHIICDPSCTHLVTGRSPFCTAMCCNVLISRAQICYWHLGFSAQKNKHPPNLNKSKFHVVLVLQWWSHIETMVFYKTLYYWQCTYIGLSCTLIVHLLLIIVQITNVCCNSVAIYLSGTGVLSIVVQLILLLRLPRINKCLHLMTDQTQR